MVSQLCRLPANRSVRLAARIVMVAALTLLAISDGLVGAAEQTADIRESAALAVPAGRQADRVAIITMEGPITEWTTKSFIRRLESAERGGADAVVIDMNTPGGEVYAILGITSAIKGSSIPNIVSWVNRQAISGGAITSVACREIVVAPGARMGDAAPIAIDPLGQLGGLADTERQKILSPLLADVVNSARLRGWDEKLVQAFLTLGVELWLVENRETGRRLFIDENEYRLLFDSEPPRGAVRVASGSFDGSAPDKRVLRADEIEYSAREAPREGHAFQPASGRITEETIKAVTQNLDAPTMRPTISGSDRGKYRYIEYFTDGKALLVLEEGDLKKYGFATETIRSDDELKDYFGASELIRLDMNWSEKLARFLDKLSVRALLVIVFLLGLFIEMAAPGIGIPGLVATVALLLLLAPAFLGGAASWWGLGAIGAGILLVLLEILVIPGFGLPAVGGVLLLFVGLVGLLIGPDNEFSAPQSQGELLFSVAVVLMGFFTAGVGVYFVSRHYGSIPLVKNLVLTNEPGEERIGVLEAMGPKAMEGAVNVGDVGVAISTLRPSGSAEFDDRIVDVVSEVGFVERGERVRVVEVSAFRVVVEPDARGGGELA